MADFAFFLDALGEAALAPFWAPVLAWTLLAMAVHLALRRWGPRAPSAAYRLAQATLFLLPLGLAVAVVADPSWIPSLRQAPVLVQSTALPAAPVATGVAVSPAAPAVPGPSASGWTLLGLATLAAGAGALVGLGALVRQSARLRKLRRALRDAETLDAQADVEAAAERVGVRRVPTVHVVDSDVVPMTLGVLRPVVVVPASLDRHARQLALVHEFQHLRQADPLAHWAEALTTGLFAAHPLAARLARQCDLLREMTCDAAVLALAADDRRPYAELVSSFAVSPRQRWAPGAIGMASPLPHVHQRILAMTRSSASPSARLTSVLVLGALVVGALAMTAGGAVAQPAQAVVVVGGSAEDAILIVDGVRIDGSFEDIDPETIYTVDIDRGDVARASHGASGVIRVTTRDAAERAGLEPLVVEEAQEDSNRPVPGSPRFVVTESTFDGGPDTAEGSAIVELRSQIDGGVTFRVESEPRAIVQGDVIESVSNASPLVVVDGTVVGNQEDLVALGIADIASVEVIEGSEAVDLYGARAVGGVLQIRTHANAAAIEAAAEAEAPAAFGLVGTQPNPASDAVEIVLAMPAADEVRVEIYDLSGRLVLSSRQRVPAGTSGVRVDVTDLAPGAYVARLTTLNNGQRQSVTTQFTVAR